MEQLAKNALIIFIKNPEKGKVKTRLAKEVGADKALAIYRALLAHTRKIALAVPTQRFLFYSEYIDEKDGWSDKDFIKLLQIDANLGAKMANAFQQVLAQYKKAVIIGSDCASLTPEIVQKAFDKLETFPFVIGPAMDGGYYLLGMKKFRPEIFEQIEWSTASVLSSTIQRIESLEKKYYLLPELSDIDHKADWDKFGWTI